MPAALVKDFAKRSGKPLAYVEKHWDKAKQLVKKNYDLDEPKSGDDSPKYWKLVVGILKRMLKLEHAADDDLDRIVTEAGDAPKHNKKRYVLRMFRAGQTHPVPLASWNADDYAEITRLATRNYDSSGDTYLQIQDQKTGDVRRFQLKTGAHSKGDTVSLPKKK